MSNRINKPKKTSKEIVDMMRDEKGISFKYMSEAAAADYQELTRLLGEKEAAEMVLMEKMEAWEEAQESMDV